MSKKKPPKYMAEVTLYLYCGGSTMSYIPCKSPEQLEKKLRKGLVDGMAEFESFSVHEGAIMGSEINLITVH